MSYKIPGLKSSKTLVSCNTNHDSGAIPGERKPEINNFMQCITPGNFFYYKRPLLE